LGEGIDLTRIARLGERPIDMLVDMPAIDRLAALGLVAVEGKRLRATAAGMPVLNAILGEVVAVREPA